MKKLIWVLLAPIMLLLNLTGCAKDNGILKNDEPITWVKSDVSWMKDAELEYNRGNGAKVYFTSDISPTGLISVYKAIGVEPKGSVAVKISTGEPPRSNYLRPELIKDLVQSLTGTITVFQKPKPHSISLHFWYNCPYLR